MKEDEKWIKAFKDKLEDYSEPMPASGWERLERELMPVTEKRIYPYRRWAVAAAAVVLVVTTAVSLYFLNSPVADESVMQRLLHWLSTRCIAGTCLAGCTGSCIRTR